MRITVHLLWDNTIRLPAIIPGYGDTNRLLAELSPSADPARRCELYERLVRDAQSARNPERAVQLLMWGQRFALERIYWAIRAGDIRPEDRKALVLSCFCEVVHRIGPETRVGPALHLGVKQRVFRELERSRAEWRRLMPLADRLTQAAEVSCLVDEHLPDDVLEAREVEAAMPTRADLEALARQAQVKPADLDLLWRVHADELSYREVARATAGTPQSSTATAREEARLRKRSQRARARLANYVASRPEHPIAKARDMMGCARKCQRP